MNGPEVVLANLLEPGDFSILAKSINTAFGPLLHAAVESGTFVLRTQGIEVQFDGNGELITASDVSGYSTVSSATG